MGSPSHMGQWLRVSPAGGHAEDKAEQLLVVSMGTGYPGGTPSHNPAPSSCPLTSLDTPSPSGSQVGLRGGAWEGEGLGAALGRRGHAPPQVLTVPAAGPASGWPRGTPAARCDSGPCKGGQQRSLGREQITGPSSACFATGQVDTVEPAGWDSYHDNSHCHNNYCSPIAFLLAVPLPT